MTLVFSALWYYITFGAYFENKPYTIKSAVFFIRCLIVCSFATEIRAMIINIVLTATLNFKKNNKTKNVQL